MKKTIIISAAVVLAAALFFGVRSCSCSGEKPVDSSSEQSAVSSKQPAVDSSSWQPAVDSSGQQPAVSSEPVVEEQPTVSSRSKHQQSVVGRRSKKAQAAVIGQQSQRQEEQPAVSSEQPQAAVSSEQPQAAVSSEQPQPAVSSEQPQAAVSSEQPQPAVSNEQSQEQSAVSSEQEEAPAAAEQLPTADSLLPTEKYIRYEIGLYGTLGLSQLFSDVVAGNMEPAGIAPGVGVDFSWFFAQRWGIGAGVEAAFFNVRLFNATVWQPGVSTTPYLLKHTDELFAAYLRVPLWLRFRAPVGRHGFYAAAGASVDLALSGRCRTETEERTGGAVQSTVTTTSPNFGQGVSIAIETGLRWTLSENWGLYTGIYGGYGLSDVNPSNSAELGINKMRLLSAGAKVKIVFGK
ncbi:MAG: hypothetical protein LBN98_02655 [Prevotellaceae bacterium]|jgi:hypothetical protein|nr:hypothetical protein [Prevotellaceae bacterium]